MPVINGGWEIINHFDELKVGDVIRYTDKINLINRKLGFLIRRSKFIITNLIVTNKREIIMMRIPDGQISISFKILEIMELKMAPGIKVFERKKDASN